MSKYHKIKIENEEYIMRDVKVPPFEKKFRVAPIELKEKILEKLSRKDNMDLLRYLNHRIHFFIDKSLLHIEDKELIDYLEKNLDKKNDIMI